MMSARSPMGDGTKSSEISAVDAMPAGKSCTKMSQLMNGPRSSSTKKGGGSSVSLAHFLASSTRSLPKGVCCDRGAVGFAALNPPYGACSGSQAEYEKHGRVAHLLELRRVDEPGLGSRARSRCDRHILLAVDLEAHRRRGNARADIELPQFRKRGVVIGRNRAVQERVEDEPAAGRERAGIVGVTQVHAVLDFARHRVDGGEVAFIALGGLEGAAVPAPLLAVLRGVDRHVLAIAQGRDVDELGFGAVGGRPVVVAAGMTRADLLGRLERVLIGDAGIGLDVLGGII